MDLRFGTAGVFLAGDEGFAGAAGPFAAAGVVAAAGVGTFLELSIGLTKGEAPLRLTAESPVAVAMAFAFERFGLGWLGQGLRSGQKVGRSGKD